MHPYFVTEDKYIPISERDDSLPWLAKIGYKTIVENIPPRRRIYIDCNLVSEYEISDRESERIAIIYLFLNGIFKNQKSVATAWGLHKNTVNNYFAAYRLNGIKGLSNSLYHPEKIRRTALKKDCATNIQNPVYCQIDINTYLSNDAGLETCDENKIIDIPKPQEESFAELKNIAKENDDCREVKKK